jgi:arsenite methyltransferase
LNLLPDGHKPQVWREIYRVLKVGGRVIVSDVLARKELSEEMKKNAALLVGCVAGAALVENVEKWMREVGLEGECPDFYLRIFSCSNCV